jgi:hypothetical protein
MDAQTLLVLLAREAGYLKTVGACQRLSVSTTRLLELRRKAIEAAMDTSNLPPLAIKGQMSLPFVEPLGTP